MKTAHVEDSTYKIETQGSKIWIDDTPVALDIVQNDPVDFHVLLNERPYRIQIIQLNSQEKTATLKVNANVYTVRVKDDLDLLLEKLGMEAGDASGSKEVKAPMPGLIIDVLVKKGQPVGKGEPLMILEAMKMENVIKSPAEGVVTTLQAAKGESVEKGKTLLTL